MAEFPAMPLWTDAYVGDTMHLTTIEHGAYLLLLIAMWRSKDKRLPHDDELLARYAKMPIGQWRKKKSIIMPFFSVKDGCIFQSRLTDEAESVRQHRQRQSDAGKASALKRKGRHSTTVEPKGNQKATPTPTPIISPNGDISPKPPKKSKWSSVDRPDNVTLETWNDFERHRKGKGTPITHTVIKGFEREAAKLGWTLEAALAESIERNWQGFKADWVGGNRNGNGHRNNGSIDGFLDAAMGVARGDDPFAAAG